MANKTHVNILMQGVDAWNQWRKDNPKIAPDLRGRNRGLIHQLVFDAFLRTLKDTSDLNANDFVARAENIFEKLPVTYDSKSPSDYEDENNEELVELDFTDADISEANFSNIRLNGATLARAHLCNADLRSAN